MQFGSPSQQGPSISFFFFTAAHINCLQTVSLFQQLIFDVPKDSITERPEQHCGVKVTLELPQHFRYDAHTDMFQWETRVHCMHFSLGDPMFA